MATESDILVENLHAVTRVTFNRPRSLNAFTKDMLNRAADAIEACGKDETARVIVLTGAGNAFSAGADLAASTSASPVDTGTIDAVNRLTHVIREIPKPVLAAVNGPAVGVGCSFALAADLAVATESTYFLLAFANVALMPDGGATLLLPSAIGRARATRMAMLAERIPASVAADWGLIAYAVPDTDFDAKIHRLATQLANGPTEAFAQMKQAFNTAALANLDDTLTLERAGQAALFDTHDYAEGIAAFRAKRTPHFTGA